jgi:hypothetical protein
VECPDDVLFSKIRLAKTPVDKTELVVGLVEGVELESTGEEVDGSMELVLLDGDLAE